MKIRIDRSVCKNVTHIWDSASPSWRYPEPSFRMALTSQQPLSYYWPSWTSHWIDRGQIMLLVLRLSESRSEVTTHDSFKLKLSRTHIVGISCNNLLMQKIYCSVRHC
jgi:hypothetical protein